MTAARDAQCELLLRLGDDRLVLGHRLSEWCGHGPILEEDVAITNIALDLLGQAQRILELAGNCEGRSRDADALAYFRGPTEFRNCLLVEQPIGDFADTMARQLVFDCWDASFLAELTKSPWRELAEWAAKAHVEAQYHARHSRGWVVRLGDGTEEGRVHIQRALDQIWPFRLELFEDDEVSRALAEAGIAPLPSSLREVWEHDVGAALHDATLRVPETPGVPQGGRSGVHSEHLERLLSEMQCLARAHPGAEW